jgi:hypothetical protein
MVGLLAGTVMVNRVSAVRAVYAALGLNFSATPFMQ